MPNTLILLLILLYFGLLYAISYFTGKKHSENAAFFLGNRKAPWHAVAWGMVGASLSGISLVSVPGMVGNFDMTYLQMVLGFLPGYAVIALILLPVYYRMNLPSIYSYLDSRIGKNARKTAAGFFILSRTAGAAVRLYVAVSILQTYVFDAWRIPFMLTAAGFLLMIWLYTRKSGIRTLIWTDLLQTSFLVAALILIIRQVAGELNLDFTGIITAVKDSPHARIFVFDDWHSRQHFLKQFLGGMFVTIAMTGVDQEMMQKNLACRNLREAQKNVCACGLFFIPVNFLLLSLGILALQTAAARSIVLPAMGDEMLPTLIAGGYFGRAALIFFVIGIIAVTFASADSALTGLTTSICADFLGIEKRDEKNAQTVRLRVHLAISIAFIGIMMLFKALNNTSVIDALYRIVSYTYGPLLGLFTFGIVFKTATCDRVVPYICLLSPVLCFAGNILLETTAGYSFGYELLIVNAALTVAGLLVFRKKTRG